MQEIGDQITRANGLPHYDFVLIDKLDTVNAFALPGRVIFIFTGVLPVMENRSGCAMARLHL